MCKFRFRLIVALLTFGIGTSGVYFWLVTLTLPHSIQEMEVTNKTNFIEVTNTANSYAATNENDEIKGVNSNVRVSKESFRVDAFEDNELFSHFFFRNGLLTKSIGFNTQTKKQESRQEYFYKKGKLERIKINGAPPDSESKLLVDKEKKDLQFQVEFLKSKNIKISFADIFSNEISDLTEVLSVADHYNDFQTEVVENGNQKTIKFIGFNKNIQLKHSIISMLIHIYGTKINFTINDYELTLKDNYPSREMYKTNDGEVMREFFYFDGKLVKISYIYTNLENQTNSLEKRFDYQKLN